MTFPGLGRGEPRATHRLFFALWPDDDTRASIAEAAAGLRRSQRPQGRWIKPHRYHMTLDFLGEHAPRPDALIDLALAAGDRVRARAFDMPLDVAGSFANRSIPWWLGCREIPAGLAALVQGVAEALGTRAGASTFAAHVTILRDAARALPPTPIAPVRWRVADFVLIESVIAAASRYEILARWPLRD